jgi:hypothetical protein
LEEKIVALSPKKRERILEEEQLRFEIRKTLEREHCAKNRPSRLLWWVAVAALVYAAFSFFACGGPSCSHGPAHCPYQGGLQDGYTVAPGQPLPPKK